MSVASFYDGFAADYHLAYGGDWERAVDRQGAALDRLVQGLLPAAASLQGVLTRAAKRLGC